ncbi:MAG TPA: phage major tail tube protein [Polyangiaceae bacterium]|nr:phage major tail tube protein [Polyangiaceae bacterium]
MDIKKVYNVNVYIDGTTNAIGKGSEVTLPDVATETESHRALGMFSAVELPTGLAAMVTKIKWAGFYPEVLKFRANPFASHRLQLRGTLETHTSGGRTGQQPFIVSLTCAWKKAPLGGFKPGAGQDVEDELTTTYIKVQVAGQDVVEIDVLNNIWIVDGVDVLEQYRQNLGG